ncbi:hypothetical protein [Paracidovorax valerianellae]|uniref:Uncharacterized protein n=1 Tax=Paracidovorax valerianellae TaxID=187868 RepID=A0A1G7DU59_9BURK|nr:hypothetical protein [Paracidovorax valerianellae]MDA8446728.1 hypothetical protein [Paracidovorax valerianellae]SDE55003.1 hypothetical protein SAMN05192589_12055 [Paracidovorax valerianellae]
MSFASILGISIGAGAGTYFTLKNNPMPQGKRVLMCVGTTVVVFIVLRIIL